MQVLLVTGGCGRWLRMLTIHNSVKYIGQKEKQFDFCIIQQTYVNENNSHNSAGNTKEKNSHKYFAPKMSTSVVEIWGVITDTVHNCRYANASKSRVSELRLWVCWADNSLPDTRQHSQAALHCFPNTFHIVTFFLSLPFFPTTHLIFLVVFSESWFSAFWTPSRDSLNPLGDGFLLILNGTGIDNLLSILQCEPVQLMATVKGSTTSPTGVSSQMLSTQLLSRQPLSLLLPTQLLSRGTPQLVLTLNIPGLLAIGWNSLTSRGDPTGQTLLLTVHTSPTSPTCTRKGRYRGSTRRQSTTVTMYSRILSDLVGVEDNHAENTI